VPDQRLLGGYLNSVVYRDGTVHKRYVGVDGEARRNLEYAALVRLRRWVAVPGATPGPDAVTLLLDFADGTNGQELIRQGNGASVLQACGEALRRLQNVDPGPLRDLLPGHGSTIVHGDFGPQNTLLDRSATAVTAILDWEFCHLGTPIEDLAWAEWIVRRHHPEAVGCLPALFAGYGTTPRWPLRKRSMARSIRAMRSFAVAAGQAANVRLWNERLDDLLACEGNHPMSGEADE
jgi:hypothetical protein